MLRRLFLKWWVQGEYKATAIASSSGWSIIATQVPDSVYNTNGIDGSLLTKFKPDEHRHGNERHAIGRTEDRTMYIPCKSK